MVIIAGENMLKHNRKGDNYRSVLIQCNTYFYITFITLEFLENVMLICLLFFLIVSTKEFLLYNTARIFTLLKDKTCCFSIRCQKI